MAQKKRFILHRSVERKHQRFVPGLQQRWNKVRDHLRGDCVPVQHCQVWPCRAWSESFLCSSTIMFPSHYHRNKKGKAQIRMSFHSLSSLLPKQTVPANGRSTLSLLLTPFLTPTFSHIPWRDPVCILDEATDLQKQVIIKWLQELHPHRGNKLKQYR